MTNKIKQSNINKHSNKTRSIQEKPKHTGSLSSGIKVEKKQDKALKSHERKVSGVTGELKDRFEHKSHGRPKIFEREVKNKEKALSIEEKGEIFQKVFEVVTDPKNKLKDRTEALKCLLEFRNDEDRSDEVDEALNGIMEDLRDAYETDKSSDDAKLYEICQSFDDQTRLQTFQEAMDVVTNLDESFENRSKALVRLLELKNEGEIDNKALNGIIEDLRDAYESETLEGQKNENLSDDARLYNVYESFESKIKPQEEYVTHKRESISKKPLEYVSHEREHLSKKETPKNETVAIKNQFETFLESVVNDKMLTQEEKRLATSAQKLVHALDRLSHSYKGMVEELKKIPINNFIDANTYSMEMFNKIIKYLENIGNDPLGGDARRLRLSNIIKDIEIYLPSKDTAVKNNPQLKEAIKILKKIDVSLSDFIETRNKTSGLKIADKATIDKLKKDIFTAKLQYFGLQALRWGSMLLLAAACVAIIALAILFHPIVLVAWPVTGLLSGIIGITALHFGEDKFRDIEHAYRHVEYDQRELKELEKQLKNSNEQQVQLRKFIQKLNQLTSQEVLSLKVNPKEAEEFIKLALNS